MKHHIISSLAPLWVTLSLATSLLACQETPEPLEEPPGAAGKTDKIVFDEDGELINPRADSDGDGIPDGEEVEGWTVTVDGNGFAVGSVGVDSAGNPVKESLEVRKVTSDPRFADTDGDGLTDDVELRIKSDPRRFDTDGDTLSDYDEHTRWGTSVSSADTDGDARGGDPKNPRPPLFALFDAAELRLMKDPLNPDGPLIPGPGATSPLTNDTDGDGVLDYHELLSGTRDPTIAEVPKIKFMPTQGAQLDMYFNVKRDDGTTQTTTHGTTTSFEEGGYLSLGTSTRINFERSDYVASYLKTKDTGGCCLTIFKSESELGIKYDTETRLEQTIAVSLNTGAYFNSQHALQEAETYERTSGVEFSSGTIRVPLDVVNTGPVPVRLQSLAVSITRYDRINRQYVPVTEIEGQDMSLAVGERRTLELTAPDVPVQAMRALLADPSSLKFEASRFSLVDQYGLDFDFRMSDVLAYSSSITLDYGERTETFFVASSIEPTGVSLGMALTQAGVKFSAEPTEVANANGEKVWAITINGLGTELHEGPAPDLQERFPYPPGLEPGQRAIKRGWFGAIRYVDGEETEAPYSPNLFDFMVKPGDQVVLVYSEDLDRDGVSAADEQRWGSSDNNPHSDLDGMSDYWETRVGWMVETNRRAPYRVFSSPVETDTDRDGMHDDLEAEPSTRGLSGLDPWLEDTDDDGFSDLFETIDQAYGLNPLAEIDPNTIPRPAATCEIAIADRPNGRANEPYRYVVHATGTDPQQDLVELKLDFGGPLGLYQASPRDKIEAHLPLNNCFPNPATVRATATDKLGFSAEVACAWAAGAPHTEDPCNGVDDDCDGVIDDGCPAIGGALTFDQPAANLPWIGGSGTLNQLSCAGRLINTLKVYSGVYVDKLGAFCTTPTLGTPYIPDGESEYIYPVFMNGWDALIPEFGGGGANNNMSHANCRDIGLNTAAVGIWGGAAGAIDRVGLHCSSMVVKRINGTWQLENWWTGDTTAFGGDGGTAFSRSCPPGTLIEKMSVQAGDNFVQALSPECARPTIPIIPVK